MKLLFPLVAACGTSSSPCGTTEAKVDRVIDGDTIVLTDGQKVRYLLVDAPETTLGHDDCYGSNAAQFNSDLVLGKNPPVDEESRLVRGPM